MTAYRLQPARNGISSVAADVGADDEYSKKRRQSDQHHVHAEIRTYIIIRGIIITIVIIIIIIITLVAWHSGRMLVFGRRTFPVLRSTCS